MKSTSRRSFLATAGTLIAAAAVTPMEAVRPPRLEDAPARSGRTGAASPASAANNWVNNQPLVQSTSPYQFTPELFQPLIGTQFKVADSHSQRATLRLMAVDDLKKENLASKTAFALRFQLVGGKSLPQGTYQFFTPPLGTFLMFVVPSRPSKNTSYTAVINRI